MFQQVTVGYNKGEKTKIGDNVEIYAGAIVIGGVEIGDGSTIGAGAVVTHDVNPNDIVVGSPARSIGARKID